MLNQKILLAPSRALAKNMKILVDNLDQLEADLMAPQLLRMNTQINQLNRELGLLLVEHDLQSDKDQTFILCHQETMSLFFPYILAYQNHLMAQLAAVADLD